MAFLWLWLTLVVVGLLTFGIRLSFLAFLGNKQLAPLLQQALRFVPVAVLSALIAPALLMPTGTLALSFTNSRLLAGLLAILVAWRTRNILLTIAIGMASLLILQAFLPAP